MAAGGVLSLGAAVGTLPSPAQDTCHNLRNLDIEKKVAPLTQHHSERMGTMLRSQVSVSMCRQSAEGPYLFHFLFWLGKKVKGQFVVHASLCYCVCRAFARAVLAVVGAL